MIPSAGVGIVVLTNAAPSGSAKALGASFTDLVQFGMVTRDGLPPIPRSWPGSRHGNSLATIRYRMSDGLNFVVVDKVEVESSHSRTSNRCSFDKLRAWPVGSDLDYCIRLRTPARTQRRAKRRSIATAQQGGTH